ncbi:MAG: hypothetical protein MI794_15965 [Pseudomonadales bacterium]|nr:hypothetical protein [Pseudomonadales bacterium]
MKYLMKPLFLIVALLSVWSSQAMAGLTEENVRGVVEALQELRERGDELHRLVPELQNRVDREAEARAAQERAFEQAIMSGDEAVQRAAIAARAKDLALKMRDGQAKSMEDVHKEWVSILKSSDAGSEFVEEIAERHGFSDLDGFLEANMRVMKVAAMLVVEQSQMASAPVITPEMRNSPYFSEEQAAEWQAQIDARQEAFNQQFADVTDAEKRAVAPFMNELVRDSEDDDEYNDY